MENRNRNPSPSMRNIRIKLNTIARCHDNCKIAFQQLKAQIRIALLEAEEVFASLSIPLTRLVGIKTEEMAEEGKSTCILINRSFPLDRSYASLAAKECRELEEKKRQQLQQLVLLLRQIEALVNSQHNTVLERLDDHRLSLRGLFQKATTYLSSIRPPDPTLIATYKLLQATFKQVGLALSSVEADVEALVQALSEKMCEPMASHVQGLVAEIEGGGLARLVEEMELEARERRIMAQAAGERAKKAEEAEAEAVKRLRGFEEKMRGMKELLGLLVETKRRGMEPSAPAARKLLAAKNDVSSDDEKLLWDILEQRIQMGVTERKPSNTFHHAETPPNRYLHVHGDEMSTSLGNPSRKKGSASSRSIIVGQRPNNRSYTRNLESPSMPKVSPSSSDVDPVGNGRNKRRLSSVWPSGGGGKKKS
ncbi:hypothetical protein ACLOJK_002253 [Asimina triloba]